MILVPHRSMLAGHFINAWHINKLYIHTYIHNDRSDPDISSGVLICVKSFKLTQQQDI